MHVDCYIRAAGYPFIALRPAAMQLVQRQRKLEHLVRVLLLVQQTKFLAKVLKNLGGYCSMVCTTIAHFQSPVVQVGSPAVPLTVTAFAVL